MTIAAPSRPFDRKRISRTVLLAIAGAVGATCGGDGGSNGGATGGTQGGVGVGTGGQMRSEESGGSGGPGGHGTGLSGGIGSGGGVGTGGIGTGGVGVGVSTGGAAGQTSGSGGQNAGMGGRAGVLRIMPLGDSTTGSVCWRALLWQKLNQNGYTGQYDFVGSRNSDAGCSPAGYDKDNEGHPSVLVTDFVNDADDLVAGIQTPQTLLGAHPADVVLFHFATNDVWNGRTPASILTAYSTILAALRQANPKVTVLVAKLIPMDVTATTCATCTPCPTCPAGITTLNTMLAGWVSANSTAVSPITVVDQWTGFVATAGADTVDGVHPNASGSAKIANNWFSALAPLF